MQETKLKTLLEILNYSSSLLKSHNIKEARLNVELMLCEVLKCDRMKLYLDFDKPLSASEIAQFKIFLKRRLNNEPLQYIFGKSNFFGYEISVDNRVLIPRSDTEVLVEIFLENILKDKKEFYNILEIGTGSGCISIAISKELTKKNLKHKIISTDISHKSLELARKNLELNNVDFNNVELKCEDFFQINSIDSNIDYIVSNPPYIASDDINNLDKEIKEYEPLNALTDNADGYKFYEKLFNLMRNSSRKMKVFLEIGYSHKEKLTDILKKYEQSDFEYYKDYNNIYRVLKIN
jgi:release factor glutamine methyltransferase